MQCEGRLSEKSWDADADLGGGKTLDLPEGPPDFEEPPEPEFEPEPAPDEAPAPPAPVQRGCSVRPIITLVVLGLFLLPFGAVGLAVCSVATEIDNAIDSAEQAPGVSNSNQDEVFTDVLDTAFSSMERSLPQCFFVQATTQFCRSNFEALVPIIEPFETSNNCAAYQAFYVDALRQAADGKPNALRILRDQDRRNYPLGYQNSQDRCLA
ncbi:MAG: hypothetical protein WEB00_13755 [Dehalococcoidia bacterium]